MESPPKIEPSPEPAVLVSDLRKTYGPVEALCGLDLRVEPGDFLTIFGPNGAGKTTLMKVLATLTRPTEGSAIVGGKDVVRDAGAVRKRVGVISHNTFLYAQLTAMENLEFYARMYRVRAGRERALALLAKMDLTKRMHDRVATYSRGMQQRLSVARALLHDPQLLAARRALHGTRPACFPGARRSAGRAQRRHTHCDHDHPQSPGGSRRLRPSRHHGGGAAGLRSEGFGHRRVRRSSRPTSPASMMRFCRRDRGNEKVSI